MGLDRLKGFSNCPVRRVSYSAMTSHAWRVRSARRVMSSRLPIGVATRYNVAGVSGGRVVSMGGSESEIRRERNREVKHGARLCLRGQSQQCGQTTGAWECFQAISQSHTLRLVLQTQPRPHWPDGHTGFGISRSDAMSAPVQQFLSL